MGESSFSIDFVWNNVLDDDAMFVNFIDHKIVLVQGPSPHHAVDRRRGSFGGVLSDLINDVQVFAGSRFRDTYREFFN